MNKEEFLKSLTKNLKYLNPSLKDAEIEKFQNMTDYNDLDPIEEANKIYERNGINIKVTKSFLNSLSTIIEVFSSNDSKNIGQLLLFFLYLFFLIIIIKIPFIYVRDMISTIFGIFQNDNANVIWNLTIEALYAITTIIVFIRLIKNKAYNIEHNKTK